MITNISANSTEIEQIEPQHNSGTGLKRSEIYITEGGVLRRYHWAQPRSQIPRWVKTFC